MIDERIMFNTSSNKRWDLAKGGLISRAFMLDDIMNDNASNVVVFDSLGTIQGYEGAEIGKHKEFYLQKVSEAHGMSVEEMLGNVPAETYLQWTAEMIYDGKLVPKSLQGAEKIIQERKSKGFRPVIVTADIPEAAELTSKPFVESGLISALDVYAILDLGSKKNPQTWTKWKYENMDKSRIASVYEDTPANLDGALSAFQTYGFLVKETEEDLSCTLNELYDGFAP
jgi:hypothetical protein